MKYHVEGRAIGSRAAGCEGSQDQGSDCCPMPSQARCALLVDLILLVSGLEGARSRALWRRQVESVVVLALQEDVTTWGSSRDPAQVAVWVHRFIGRGIPKGAWHPGRYLAS